MKLKSILLGLLAIVSAAPAAKAQFEVDYHMPVGLVAKFQGDNSMSREESLQARLSALSSLRRDGRMVIKDAATAEDVSDEIRRQIFEAQSASDINYLSQIRNLSVDYIITGVFSNVDVVRKESKYTKKNGEVVITVTYEATMNFSYSVIRVSDGAVAYSGTSRPMATDKESGVARAKLFQAVYVGKELFTAVVPLQADLVQSDYVVKKDKLETCYVKLGSAHGVKEGTILEVFKTKYIAGQPVMQSIGYLEITSVVAPGLSDCKVRKRGGKEILVAIKENLKLKTVNEDTPPLQVKVINSLPNFLDKIF